MNPYLGQTLNLWCNTNPVHQTVTITTEGTFLGDPDSFGNPTKFNFYSTALSDRLQLEIDKHDMQLVGVLDRLKKVEEQLQKAQEAYDSLAVLIVKGAFAPGSLLSEEIKRDFYDRVDELIDKLPDEPIAHEKELKKPKKARIGKKTRDRLKRQGRWPPDAMPTSAQQHRYGYD